MPLTISVMMTKKDFLLLARPISNSWIAWQQNDPVKDQQIRQDTSAELQGLAMWSQLKAADVTNSLQDLLVYEKKPSQNGWGWKGPWRSPHPMGPAQTEPPTARCQGLCPESFEFSHEYQFHNLSGHPGHPRSKKVSLMFRQSPLCCSLCCVQSKHFGNRSCHYFLREHGFLPGVRKQN